MNIDSRGWSGVLPRTLGSDGTTATRARGEARPGRRHDAPVSASTDVYQRATPVVPAIPVPRTPTGPTVPADPVTRGGDAVAAAPVPRDGGAVAAAPVPRDPAVVAAAPVPRERLEGTAAPVLPVPERPSEGLVVSYRPSAR